MKVRATRKKTRRAGTKTRPTSISPALQRFLRLLDIAERVRKASRSVRGKDKQLVLAFYKRTRGLARQSGHAEGVRSLERDLLAEWNEGVGADVEEFWNQVRKAKLSVKRSRDIVVETLARGRVASMDEYVALEDHFEDLQRCRKVTPENAEKLDAMLDAFQAKHPQYFEGGDPEPLFERGIELPVEVGKLTQVSATSYCFCYAGMERARQLQNDGYQGGGESWAGITRGLLELHAPALVTEVRLDPEGDALVVWASDPGPLQVIATLIARALKSRPLLTKAIRRAGELAQME